MKSCENVNERCAAVDKDLGYFHTVRNYVNFLLREQMTQKEREGGRKIYNE